MLKLAVDSRTDDSLCMYKSRRCVAVFSVVAIFAVSAALVVTLILVAVTRRCRSVRNEYCDDFPRITICGVVL